MLPTTERDADTLARRHGYSGITDLAHSLPLHAKVIDVGAGASTLGSAAARLRPDIQWINLDFNYRDERILKAVGQGTPPNLTFVAGDVMTLDAYVEPASIDAVFSYWLFPHLSLYDQQTALTAAAQLYRAAKSGGILAVGPRKQPMLHPDSLRGKSWRVRKDKELTAESYSRKVLRQTQLSAANRYVRIAFDTAAAELFGTSRYIKGKGIGQQVYNPRSGTYIPLHDYRAMYLVVRLLFGTLVRLISPRRLDSDTSL